MLERRLSLLQAVSLNMSMMVGIGPFITIPALVGTMGGPQAMIGWVLGATVALADGMVWSELAAAFPGSGGTYHFYDAAYGDRGSGRLLKFLFVWQFLFSGPLEVATGAIGMANTRLFLPELWGSPPGTGVRFSWYRRQRGLGPIGRDGGHGAGHLPRLSPDRGRGPTDGRALGRDVDHGGLGHRDRADPFRRRPRPLIFRTGRRGRFDLRTAMGLGMALAIAMYDFLGYYQVCYLGDEVADPSRTIPRSILISVLWSRLIYLTMNIGILGVLPWREVVASKHIASDLMLRVHGSRAAAW